MSNNSAIRMYEYVTTDKRRIRRMARRAIAHNDLGGFTVEQYKSIARYYK